jgi:spermidine synthase
MNTQLSTPVLNRISLCVIVFIAGASVMVIELLGTRLIAPFYGSSLYVWSSLIAVTMISLALGYFVGGQWADKARHSRLSFIIALAALLTLLIPWLNRPVLLLTDPMGLRAGAFMSAICLFLPSLMLLGMVTPFAIKLSATQLNDVGQVSGTMYAVSTLGSVIGTLTLGFFLFPMLGSREILMGNSLLLFVLAVVVAIAENKRRPDIQTILPCFVLVAVGLSFLPVVVQAGYGKKNDKFNVLAEHESLYGWVRVIDEPSRDLRLLTSDASAIGAASLRTGESQLSYQDIVGLIPELRPKMTKALIIGLGAGHMATVLFERYGIISDVLEIDPIVAKSAVDYFGFKPNGKVIVGDARYEIRHLSEHYDLIIHDCFTGGSEPAHLLTIETLTQLKERLTPDGILAVNFVAFSSGENSALPTVANTIAHVFPQQSTFISEPNKTFNDFIFLASMEPIDIQNEKLKPEHRLWLENRLFSVDAKQGIVLSDNFNPLEHLQAAKAEKYRHFLMDMFGTALFVR